jgi:two-component system NarL family response regulator
VPEPIRVILADDHAMLRDCIRVFLEQAEGIVVVAEAENGREAVELTSKHMPDVVLIDIGMPELNGLEAARQIRAIDPEIAVIALSVHSDERYVTGMLDAGARGYLLKTCESAELLRAIEAVRRGKVYVTADVTHVLLDHRRGGARPGGHPGGGQATGAPPPDVLTPKEREVLQLIAEGLTSKEIGKRLGAALKTIETHRTNVMRKLDLHSIAGLTKYAIREGLTSLSL